MTDVGSEQAAVGRLQRIARLLVGPFAGLRIDFGQEPQQKKLTITFNFISGLVARVIVLTFSWAVAAGVLQAGRLLLSIDLLAPRSPSVSDWIPTFGHVTRPFLLIICLWPVYTLKAFGVAMLLFLAAACVGAIVGFLFGVPRPISEGGAPATTSEGAIDKPRDGDGSSSAARRKASLMAGWQANTNLTQISDWLTKIIVGVGLVEAHKILGLMADFQRWGSNQFFEGYVGVSLVLPALIIAGLVLGFLYFYLFTQLFLAAMMTFSAGEIGGNVFEEKPEAADRIFSMRGTDPAVTNPIQIPGRSAPEVPEGLPTASQAAAAISIASQPLDSLTDADSVAVWARSQAVLNQWAAAMTGYNRLLQMRRRPEELAEAARVCASAGDRARARELIDEAVRGRDRALPEARGPMTFDAVFFALYDSPPAGYTRALSLLGPEILGADHRGGLFVLRACANGQRLNYEGANLDEEDRGRIKGEMLRDLAKALQNKDNLPWIRFLMGLDNHGYPLPPAREGEERDDDLDAVRTDPEFVALVVPEPDRAKPATPDEPASD